MSSGGFRSTAFYHISYYGMVREPFKFPVEYPGGDIIIPQVAQEHVYYIPMFDGDYELGYTDQHAIGRSNAMAIYFDMYLHFPSGNWDRWCYLT